MSVSVNHRRMRRPCAGILLTWMMGWCLAPWQAAASKETRDHSNGNGKTQEQSADSTARSFSPVHSPQTDSSFDHLTFHHTAAAAEGKETAALPAWMQALNAPCSSPDLTSDVRDPFYVSERINAHNPEIKALYRKFLKQWPDLEGKLTVRIHLHPSGRVVRVEPFESTLQHNQFEDAVLQTIKTWRDFGASAKDKIMIYRQQYLFGE